MELNKIFAQKKTENGDAAYSTTLNSMLDILFMTEYYSNHLDEVRIGTSEREQLFSMFIRDPRYGLGKRDLGRKLMVAAGVSPVNIVKAGRFDDLFEGWETLSDAEFKRMADYLYIECYTGNELCKKWMPRYSSKNLMLARKLAKVFGMNKQQYGHFVKCDTTENKLSRKRTEDIVFSHVPSKAMLKYYKRFETGSDTKLRFAEYLEAVRAGKADLKVSTTNVYDIYKNMDVIDPDLFFSKIEKISGSWIPVVDSSGSMQDSNDSYGKALAVGHYLAKCSTYAPDTVLSFSSYPQLLKLGIENSYTRYSPWSSYGYGTTFTQSFNGEPSKYKREIKSMVTGDCSNTDFGALCERLKNLDPENAPEWVVVLSDMEFDAGSKQSKDEMMSLFKEYGLNTKLVWWNFNSRNKTCPETDDYGNIFMSGYSPMLLKFLEAGFNGEKFLNKLLDEYKKIVM